MSAAKSIVDLRSDTVTRPSAEMRRVIVEAEVGDAVLGDDPTATELEQVAAELLGKEAALFFPSGTMANQTAVLVQSRPGTEVLLDAGAHLFHYEEAAAAAWAGVQLRGVASDRGVPDIETVSGAFRPASPYVPEASLYCIENTHNSGGGRVVPLDLVARISEIARGNGVAVHMDGARLPNAAVSHGIPMRKWAEHVDTVMVSLSKGLGAPIGSVLAGSDEVMRRAWRVRRRLGGGMRQVGLIAAAGLYALRHNLDRLADDHRRAMRLASLAAEIPGITVGEPETNIVML
ncbi:MAG: GntG family PLP-dependent aldolase, partial [Gemmatimonadota bacterium]